MKALIGSLTGIAVAAVCLYALPGCRERASFPRATMSDALADAAWKMHAAFVQGNKTEAAKEEAQIPSSYWSDPIKALDPIKVYVHRVNIVVVQNSTGGVESGKYIYIPISSYLPQNGDDGFTFTRASQSVYEYQRSPPSGPTEPR